MADRVSGHGFKYDVHVGYGDAERAETQASGQTDRRQAPKPSWRCSHSCTLMRKPKPQWNAIRQTHGHGETTQATWR